MGSRALSALFLVLPATLLLSSCASPHSAGVPADSLVDGTIVYHQPPSSPDLLVGRRNVEAVTQIIAAGDGSVADSSRFETRSGVIEGFGEGDAGGRQAAAAIFQRARGSSTVVLPLEKFRELWEQLDEAGLFDLPPYAGGELPKDRPYFVLNAGDWRRVIALPSIGSPQPDDPGVKQLQAWKVSKIVFFQFLDER